MSTNAICEANKISVAATFENGACAIDCLICKNELKKIGLKKIGMFGYGHQVVLSI